MTTLIETIHDVDEFLSSPGKYHTTSGHQAYAVVQALLWDSRVAMGNELYYPEGSVLFVEVRKHGALTANIEKVSWGTTPDYYANLIRDYGNWQVAFWRELIQNSRDAGATKIDIECVPDVYEDPETGAHVECIRASAADNGAGMDYDTLMRAFFRRGGTEKAAGSVGGFGDAKKLILTVWLGYEVRTQDVVSRGSHEDIYPSLTSKGQPYVRGTKVTVWMPLTNHTTPEHAQFMIEQSSLPNIRFTVNGASARGTLPKGSIVEDGELPITVYGRTVGTMTVRHSPRSMRRGIYVRSHGIYMYEITGFVGQFKGVVTIDLDAPPVNVFNAKRDGLSGASSAATALTDVIRKLTVESRTALKPKRKKASQVFKGTGALEVREGAVADMAADIAARVDLGAASRRKGTKATLNLNKQEEGELIAKMSDALGWLTEQGKKTAAEKSKNEPPELGPLPDAFDTVVRHTKFLDVEHVMGSVRLSLWKPDFFLYTNLPNWNLPKALHPETMGKKYHEVLRVWTEVSRFVLIQLGMFRPFGVGWVFDTEVTGDGDEAVVGGAYVAHEGMEWLLLNPIFIDRSGWGDNASFKPGARRRRICKPTCGPDVP